jgi:hypothetical protein
MTEKRNQRELLWFQTGGALNFITAAPHCGTTNITRISWQMKKKCNRLLNRYFQMHLFTNKKKKLHFRLIIL